MTQKHTPERTKQEKTEKDNKAPGMKPDASGKGAKPQQEPKTTAKPASPSSK